MVWAASDLQPLGEQDEGRRPQARRERLAVQRARGACQHQDPPAAGGQPGGLRQLFLLAARQHHLRRSQHPGALAGEAGRAPLARRGERHGCLPRPPLRRRERLPDGGQRRVAVLVVGQRPECRPGRRLAVEPDEAVEGDGPVGQGAGLVQAHHVHPGQALDRGKLLDQDPAPGERDRGHAEGDAGQQDQALRDHADQRRDRPAGDLPYVPMGVPPADHQQHGHRPDRPGDVAQDPVDAVHQLRAHQRETPRLGGELAGVRIRAHPGGLVAARPGDHEAARQQPVTRPLADRLGLPGQQRLISLQARAGPHHPVRHQLIPGAQVDQVTGDQIRDSDVLRRAVADHPDPRGAEHGEPVERALGAQLLRDADQRVGHQHDAEQGVLRLTRDQDHGQQDTEDEVEPGQDVRPQDLRDRPAGALPARVRQPARAPLGNLGAGQAGRRRLRDRRARRQWRGGDRVSHARSPRRGERPAERAAKPGAATGDIDSVPSPRAAAHRATDSIGTGCAAPDREQRRRCHSHPPRLRISPTAAERLGSGRRVAEPTR